MLKNKHLIWLLSWICLAQFGCSVVVQTPAAPARQNPKAGVFRGVYHVHSKFSHDSKASLDLVLKSAKKADLDFVVITDHNTMDGRMAYQDMEKPNWPLLIFGNEVSTWHDGHLNTIGIEKEPPDIGDTQKIIDDVHAQNGYAILAHPLSERKPWKNWELKNYDGIEVFCFSDNFYKEGIFLIFKALLLSPKSFLESTLKTPENGLKLWDDQLSSGRKISGFSAVDAHLKLKLGNLALENYSLYLQAATMYAIASELNEPKIVEALGKGRSFSAFEVYGLAQDFEFSAESSGQTYQMGDSVKTGSLVQFQVKSPETADIYLIHNGTTVQKTRGETLNYQSNSQAGFYRVEVHLGGKLWIFSNPIYIE